MYPDYPYLTNQGKLEISTRAFLVDIVDMRAVFFRWIIKAEPKKGGRGGGREKRKRRKIKPSQPSDPNVPATVKRYRSLKWRHFTFRYMHTARIEKKRRVAKRPGKERNVHRHTGR